MKKTNWLEVFKENHCAGSAEECSKILDRFQTLNNSVSKIEANGMLAVFIDQGAKETLLRDVFGIGSGRYMKILHNRADKIGGGRNGFAITQDMLDQLHRFLMSGVSTILVDIVGSRSTVQTLQLPHNKKSYIHYCTMLNSKSIII